MLAYVLYVWYAMLILVWPVENSGQHFKQIGWLNMLDAIGCCTLIPCLMIWDLDYTLFV